MGEGAHISEKQLERFVVLVILLVIFYGLGRHYFKTEKVMTSGVSETARHPRLPNEHTLRDPQEELARIDTSQYVYDYILRVIEDGSEGLGFPGGVMEGGYVSREEAPKIACYVLELGGHRCPHSYPRDAEMFYTSVCAGCHGNDGRGIHGSYPDLTRHKLLGIERRETYLKQIAGID